MRHARRTIAAAAALGLAVLGPGCQPLPHPFADDKPPAALLAVPDSIGIAVGEFEGEPRAAAEKMPNAVTQQLLHYNIPASDETTSRASYRLDGRLEEHPGRAGKSEVVVFWRLRDAAGHIVEERSDRLSAPTRDWQEGKDDKVTELAASAVKALAARLASRTPQEEPGGGRIRVAIAKVDGAPGDGDKSLASSLSAVLKHRDIDLVDPVKGNPELDVDAEVAVTPDKANTQHVKIVWHVRKAGGGEIGTVAQENDVPRGRLDGAWGDIAYSVAMAAEGGIMQLVDRGSPTPNPGTARTAAAEPPPAGPDLPLDLPPDALSPRGAEPAAPTEPATPTGPAVAGNIDAPEVNLPPITIAPAAPAITPLPPPVAPIIPYRGVPVPH